MGAYPGHYSTLVIMVVGYLSEQRQQLHAESMNSMQDLLF